MTDLKLGYIGLGNQGAPMAKRDRVVPGGLIVFDDFGAVAGASEVAEQFAAGHGLALQKLPYYAVPAFLVKPAGC